MTWWQRFRQRDRLERELDAELRYHFDRQVEDNLRQGMSEAEARRTARLQLGGEDQAKEQCRDARGTRWIHDLARDARFAARLLANDRWFSAASILALALGIGVTAMMVTIINGYNLRGLPVDDPDRVVFAGTRDLSGADRGVPYADYQLWRVARSFSSMGAYASSTLTIGDKGLSPDSAGGAYVSRETFAILDETPVLGRGFMPGEDIPGAPPVVILGHRLWTTRYGADPGVIGRSIVVNGTAATVVGVMREGFEFPFRQALWLPLSLLPGLGQEPDEPLLDVFGRLAGGVTAAQARAELAALSAGLTRHRAKPEDRFQPSLVEFGVQQVGRLRDQQPPLIALATAVFVLLIACANVAGLLLARSAGRGREIAVRASLGATRWRLVRQLLVESLLLSVAAAALGTWFSRFGVRFVAEAFGRNVPYWMQFTVDGRVLAIVAGLCLLCTLAFGLGPALIVSRTSGGLTRDAGRTGAAPRVRRWTHTLLAAELALTVTLLAGAGLMVRSFVVLYRADQVIDPSRVLTMEMALPEKEYGTAEQRAAIYERLDERLGRYPSTAVISLASARPFVGGVRRQVSFADRQAAAGSGEPQASVVFVGSRYFEALQVPVVRGRYFRAGDVAPGQQAAVVNQRFVDVFYPNDDPIGRPIRLSDPEEDAASPWLTIVGVAPSIRQSIAAGTRPVVYLPFATHAGPRASIIVGGVSDAAGIVPGLRREIAGLDADVTLFNVRPLAELLDDSRLQPRLLGTVIAVFALIALLLSVLGLHAFTAYGVQQRTHEIGVRMALGARSEQVVRLFVRMAMVPLGIGILIGMPGALGVGRLLQGLLIQTSPTDPATLIAITVLLVSVSAAACFFPARRAARLDPLRALRND